ncbi:hypothetical protein Tcan_10931 [Toxocara canis]|uniref:Uncharacterized protein n=1 Tax=Toxocara canis TaxID=6265 RepID=A0A0B2VI18_TOXCA|nr:hypothetical protein Tcan_10931 [Toxocara canis]
MLFSQLEGKSPQHLNETSPVALLKRQQNFGGSPCGGGYGLGNYGYNIGGPGGCGNYGYGNGLGSYFYGQYGGGYNNNYGGTNIGSINTENISG